MLNNIENITLDELENWWADLTIEQRRAAFAAWCASEVQSIYVGKSKVTKNMTDDEFKKWLSEQSQNSLG